MLSQKYIIRKGISILVVLAMVFSIVGFGNLFASAAVSSTITNENPAVKNCEPAENMIPNGNLEAADAGAFWGNFYGFGWGSPWPAVDTSDSHSSGKSLKIGGDSWAPSGASGTLSIEANTEYTFSMWYKVVDNGGANFIWKLMFGDTPDVVGGDHSLTVDGQWHQLAISFNSGDAQKFVMHWWLKASDGTSYVLFDDACLFETPAGLPKASIVSDSAEKTICADEDNLLQNGNAEGDETGAFMSSSDNFAYWGTASDTVFRSGAKSFQLNTQRWGSWSGTSINPKGALEQNKEYVFSFWYKIVTTETEGDYTYKYAFKNDTDYEFFGDHSVEKDGEWHLASVTFNSGRATEFLFYFMASAANSAVYFDDMYLFESSNGISDGPDTEVHAQITEENPVKRYSTKEGNMISNYGMELGDVYWQNQKGFEWGALSISRDVVKNGVNSLRFKPTVTEANPFSDVEFSVALEAETSYTFSVWVNTQSGIADPDAYIQLKLSNSAAKTDAFDIPLSLGEGWKQYAITFTTGDKTKLTLNSGSTTADFVAYFDDFYLCKTADAIEQAPVNNDHPPYVVCARENNLIPNYNFESTNTKLWETFSGWDYGLISVSNLEHHSGSKSLLFKGTEASAWQSTDLRFPLKANTDYTFSVWVKGVGGSNALIGLMGNEGERSKWLTPQMQVKRDFGWYQVYLQFNSKKYDSISFYVGSAGSQGSGSIYLDDFYLFESKYGLAEIPATEDPDEPYNPAKPSDDDKDPDGNPDTGMGQNAMVVFAVMLTAGISTGNLICKKRKQR